MPDRTLDADERAAIAAWLATNQPRRCPTTGNGEALAWLRAPTLRERMRMLFESRTADVRRKRERGRPESDRRSSHAPK